MKQNQNLVESSSKTRSMTNFLHFFNLKMFRYSLFKQLKAVSSYVLVILMLIITFGCLVMLFLMKNQGNFEIAKENVIMFKFIFFLIYFPFFTMLIAFKSVQMVRDEIDDGTLLIFNSMPYTRTRMIVEKWLSVQIVCLFYSIILLLLPTSTSFLVAKTVADVDTVLNFKALFSLIDTMFLTSFIIQLLLSTLAILLSVVLSGKATTGLVSTFGSLAFAGPVLTMILNTMYFQAGNINSAMNYYEKAIRESGLQQYIDDPDPEIKKYFEFDGWGSNKQSISEVKNSSINVNKVFDIKSENDLASTVAKFTIDSSDAITKAAEELNRYKKTGIKIDNTVLVLQSDLNIANVKEIYGKLNLSSQPLHLTSYLKTDYNDIALFKEGSKLEKIRQILSSNYFSHDYSITNSRRNFEISYFDLEIESNDISKKLIEDKLQDLINNGQIGMDNQKGETLNLDGLYIRPLAIPTWLFKTTPVIYI